MPPRAKKPSKEAIKRAADRAEAKTVDPEYDPLDPPAVDEDDPIDETVTPRAKHPGGRPVYKYFPRYAVIARRKLEKGATLAELADEFGVNVTTIWRWRQKYEDFDSAFDAELSNAYDARIVRTLAERAAGYTYEAVKIFNGKGGPVIVPYLEHVPPDISAIKMWLSARMPDKWRIKDEVEISGDSAAFAEIWKAMGEKKNKGE